MRSQRFERFFRPAGAAYLPLLVAGTLLFALMPPTRAASAETENSCESCHKNPDFLVQNKQLYDYYQEWSISIHRQEEVTCDECHGGDPLASDKDKAHGDGVDEASPSSGVYYKNIPEMCGTCHEEILAGFRESHHFEHVEKRRKKDEQGPTCVTCHGAINSEILDVTSVEEACARCHNEETDNHPENPAEARRILNRFLSIHRFYRYIAVRAEPEEAKAFLEEVDVLVRKLSVTWHTFELDDIDQGTTEVLQHLKAKRDEIRARRKEAK